MILYHMSYWLVVSTHLKNLSQIGKLPQIVVKSKNIWNRHLAYIDIYRTSIIVLTNMSPASTIHPFFCHTSTHQIHSKVLNRINILGSLKKNRMALEQLKPCLKGQKKRVFFLQVKWCQIRRFYISTHKKTAINFQKTIYETTQLATQWQHWTRNCQYFVSHVWLSKGGNMCRIGICMRLWFRLKTLLHAI